MKAHQYRKAERILDTDLSDRWFYKVANDVAKEIALDLHGLTGWQGVKNTGMYGPSGLKRLMNAHLRSRKDVNGAAVVEQELDNGESVYYPTWK